MKPHPRIRKTIKWGGAAITSLLLVLWIGSWWYAVHARRVWGDIDLESGSLRITQWTLIQGIPSVTIRPAQGRFESFYSVRARHRQSLVETSVALWPLIGAAILGTVLAWRLDSLARGRAHRGMNLCPKCSYDRAGIAGDAKCPECGAMPVVASR
jgi:hypothetical protein